MSGFDLLLSECSCLGGVEFERLNVCVVVVVCHQYSILTSDRWIESQNNSVQCQYLLDKVNTMYGGLEIGAGSKVNEL